MDELQLSSAESHAAKKKESDSVELYYIQLKWNTAFILKAGLHYRRFCDHSRNFQANTPRFLEY